MDQQQVVSHRVEGLGVTLVEHSCTWCDGTAIAREEFKGDDAVVCAECGTPVLRSW